MLEDLVEVEDVGVVGEFGGADFEFAEAVLHQELVRVGEYLEQAVLLLVGHQGEGSQVGQLQVAHGLRLHRPSGEALVAHSSN